jgi:hypothetical protein
MLDPENDYMTVTDDSPYADFEEETVPPEEGRELPQGVDDPAAVTDADLHPLRHQNQ